MPYEIPDCAGEPYRPSNGSEGDAFIGQFCRHCVRYEEPCPILGATLFNDIGEPGYPKEWTHDDKGRPTCTAFQAAP
jgi:hypothetical protein